MRLERNGKCNTCGALLADTYYIFCDWICQRAWHKMECVGVMKHSFVGSQLNVAQCATCSRDALSHTTLARCESCHKIGTCEVVDNILMCESCERNHLLVKKDEIAQANRAIENGKKELDGALKDIRVPGDIFNDLLIKKTSTIMELRKQIDSDDSIVDKNLAWNKVIMERMTWLKDHLFQLEEDKKETVAEVYSWQENLREMGAQITQETRDRLKELDTIYTPMAKPVIPKVPKSSLSPFERVVQSFALANGITMEQAREKLIKGGIK